MGSGGQGVEDDLRDRGMEEDLIPSENASYEGLRPPGTLRLALNQRQ